jgi:hypothetical protein
MDLKPKKHLIKYVNRTLSLNTWNPKTNKYSYIYRFVYIILTILSDLYSKQCAHFAQFGLLDDGLSPWKTEFRRIGSGIYISSNVFGFSLPIMILSLPHTRLVPLPQGLL